MTSETRRSSDDRRAFPVVVALPAKTLRGVNAAELQEVLEEFAQKWITGRAGVLSALHNLNENSALELAEAIREVDTPDGHWKPTILFRGVSVMTIYARCLLAHYYQGEGK